MRARDNLRCTQELQIRSPQYRLMIALAAVLCLSIGCHSGSGESRAWQKVTPQEVGLDSSLIGKLVRDANQGTFPNLHSIIVVKDGRIAVEEYLPPFGKDSRQFTASVSKSVGSILVGIAMDQGLLPGPSNDALDMPLVELLPEYEETVMSDPRKAGIKFRHVLSMSAGLEWDEQTYPYSDDRNDWVRASQSEDPVRFTLERPLAAPPGSTFNYNGGLSILLAYLVQRESGMPADEFARQYLFDPLGISDYEWERLPSGLTDTDGGLHLRPLDMAKLGQLYLDGGVWHGKRLVSAEWVAQSSKEHILNSASPNYGLQWWCGEFHYRGQSTYIYMASGYGGQKIFVIPAHEMVVVLTHEVFDNPLGELRNLSIMSRYILPAASRVIPDGEPDADRPRDLGRFVGTYRSPRGLFTIELRDGSLHASSPGAPAMGLVHVTGSRFRGVVMELLDVDFAFNISESGQVKGGRVSRGFMSEQFTREHAAGEQ